MVIPSEDDEVGVETYFEEGEGVAPSDVRQRIAE